MSIFTYQDGNVAVKKHNIIFAEGQNAQSVNILLQGKVDVFMSPLEEPTRMGEEELLKKSFRIFSIDQNMFIGTAGLFLSGQHFFTYRAAEDCNIYVFCTQTPEKFNALLDSHKEYGAYIMTSISNCINLSIATLEKLNALIQELNNLTGNLLIYFWHMKEKFGFQSAPSSTFFREGLDVLQSLKDKRFSFPQGFTADFFEEDRSNLTDLWSHPLYTIKDEDALEYHKRFVNMPAESRKNFFAADNFITSYHCTESSKFLSRVQDQLRNAISTVSELLKKLYAPEGECLLSEYAKAASELKLENPETYEVFKTLDYIAAKIKEIASGIRTEYKYDPQIDNARIESMIDQVKIGGKPAESTGILLSKLPGNAEGNHPDLPEELKGSVHKLLEYSAIPKDRAELFTINLEAFLRLRDRFSLDDEASNVRKTIASVFFEIYERVLKRVLDEKSQSRLHHMFLTFGFMDERLLLPEQSLALYSMVDKFTGNGQDSVYNMRDWLSAIYEMRRDPSMNEFSQDYFDRFREMKKRREVTDRDKQAYTNDRDARLNFEVNNMFRVNHRVCYGQPGTYFPLLHSDMITRDIEKALVTPERIQEGIAKVLEVDFSAFHRELSYRNPDKGIEKELVMKAVMPDFILMPTFGTRAIMWQEIAGRDRSTPGRFILPILTGENLDDMILKLVGNFRWELCRTMMGAGWNDITQKSLTSEYMDYIQFYKKNKELPEDAKEKIAAQISRYRNMMRDIFTADYEQWIHFESKGVVRLNKVSRSILFRHCPFPKAAREQLTKHPLFSDLETQFKTGRAKQARDLENRYNKLLKPGVQLDADMAENLRFYKEM